MSRRGQESPGISDRRDATGMRLAIDASNARGGGGLVYLVELLRAADPLAAGFDSVTVFGGAALRERIEDRPWLRKAGPAELDGPLPSRVVWQQLKLPRLLRRSAFDVLFAPGGTVPRRLPCPAVTVSQNLLPFDERERRRYPPGAVRLRLELLRRAQLGSFARADGVIFLSQHARRVLAPQVPGGLRRAVVVPHGVHAGWQREPPAARGLDACSAESPLRLLYVSIVDEYKHQWNVAQAVAALRREGLPVEITFAGPAHPPALRRLLTTLDHLDPSRRFLRYTGPVEHGSLRAMYQQAELFVFASTCENLPIILIEAMAAGLPIVSSPSGPMPEVLGDAGVYADAENVEELTTALRRVAMDADLRDQLARRAERRSRAYSWAECARRTLAFVAETAAPAARWPHG